AESALRPPDPTRRVDLMRRAKTADRCRLIKVVLLACSREPAAPPRPVPDVSVTLQAAARPREGPRNHGDQRELQRSIFAAHTRFRSLARSPEKRSGR